MEEQLLPWWKRAIRAAIGTLKSGFGLFGRTQPEVKTVEPVVERVDEVQIAQSIEKSEPEFVTAPKPEAIVIEEPQAEVVADAAIAVEEESATADPSTALRSAQDDKSSVKLEAQDDKSLDEQEVVEIEPTEEIVEVVEKPDESAEVAKTDEVIDFDNETVAEGGLTNVNSEPVEEIETVEIEAEVVEQVMAVEEPEIGHEDKMEIVPEPEEETVEAVDVDFQIEAVIAEPAEEELQIAEDNVEHEDLIEVQPDDSGAESSPEPQNEIEEMKPLRENEIPEVETINTDTENGVSESVAEAHEPECEPEAPVVEIAVEEAAELNEEATQETAAPVERQETAAPVAAAVAQVEPLPVKHVIKEEDDKSSPFSIIVSQIYEGPMDLLLDLIRKQDIDIYDIPIAKITEQFLTYVERLRASDMDMAGEFIYTASLLIHIKSKTLLPRAPVGQDDYEDPRRELVERLLEHERFKNAAAMLQQKQILEDATWTNPGIREFKGDAGTEPELAADTVDLVRVFREILDRARNRPVINVEEDAVTVGQMIQFLGRRLNMEDRPIALRKLLAHTHSQRALVAMFLALLELVRLQAILLRQDKLFSEIFIKKSDGFDSVMTEGFLAARDDWA